MSTFISSIYSLVNILAIIELFSYTALSLTVFYHVNL